MWEAIVITLGLCSTKFISLTAVVTSLVSEATAFPTATTVVNVPPSSIVALSTDHLLPTGAVSLMHTLCFGFLLSEYNSIGLTYHSNNIHSLSYSIISPHPATFVPSSETSALPTATMVVHASPLPSTKEHLLSTGTASLVRTAALATVYSHVYPQITRGLYMCLHQNDVGNDMETFLVTSGIWSISPHSHDIG